jgi:hypothetical protein
MSGYMRVVGRGDSAGGIHAKFDAWARAVRAPSHNLNGVELSGERVPVWELLGEQKLEHLSLSIAERPWIRHAGESAKGRTCQPFSFAHRP